MVPYADMTVIVEGPGVIAPESSATVTFTITNNGPSTAVQPYLIITRHSSLGGWPVGCTALGPDQFHCYAPSDLAPGESWSLELEVFAAPGTSGTTWFIEGETSSSTPDPIPQNNTDMTPLLVTYPPTVATVDPGEGPESGGTQVIIDGTNFTSDTTVEVGGVPCTPVVFVRDDRIMCTTGPHPIGPVDVVVTTGDGQVFTFRNGFTYLPLPAPDPVTPKFTG